jgi:hypothetical protein
MNTEALNTLKQIREVINDLQKQLNDASNTNEEKRMLELALSNLYDQENIILNNSLQAMVDKINCSNDELKKLIAVMKNSTEKLAKLSNTIKRISDVVGTLAEITTKAIKAGIIG